MLRQIAFIVFAFLFLGLYADAQIPQIALSGTVYDENGAVIANAEITVVGSDKILRVATTNSEGDYEIKMPIGDAAIQIKANGFQTYFLEKYRIVNSTKGKLIVDIVLIARNDHEPCGYGGDGCLPLNKLDIDKEKISNKISSRPLKEKSNKSKSKRKINNKQ